jgi:hypothetical protein
MILLSILQLDSADTSPYSMNTEGLTCGFISGTEGQKDIDAMAAAVPLLTKYSQSKKSWAPGAGRRARRLIEADDRSKGPMRETDLRELVAQAGRDPAKSYSCSLK